jgi:hypothetical protein
MLSQNKYQIKKIEILFSKNKKCIKYNKMVHNYRHNWTNRDFTILFTVCRLSQTDETRVRSLLRLFPKNAPNGLRMMIEKYEHLNGNTETRKFFKEPSKKMKTAWQEYIS